MTDQIQAAHALSVPWEGSRYETLADLLLRQRDRPLLSFFDDDAGTRQSFTVQQFRERAFRAAGLLESLGVTRGDKVSTVFENHPDVLTVFFATWILGAVAVPISVLEDDGRKRFINENAEVSVMVVQDRFADLVPAIRTLSIRHVVVAGNEDFDRELARFPASAAAAARTGDEALIVYTSGTTGLPKGVVLTHEQMLADAEGIRRHFQFGEGHRFMCVLPLHHVNGIIVTTVTPLYVGGSIVLNRRFRTSTFWQRIAEERVQTVSVVPTLLQFLLEKDLPRGDVSCLQTIICGAGPLTVELAKAFETRFGRRITHGYGLSESTCYSCYLPTELTQEEHERWMRDFGFPSIGVPIAPNEMAIHDPSGHELGEDERGEIVIRGKNIMQGYFKRPDANQETFKHRWFRSGDEGFYRTDARGRKFFFITGRLKELIIRGGENISPLEIDEVLQSIQGVRGIAVGFENKWYGEEVGAVVQLLNGMPVSPEEILRRCAERLSFFKRPKVVKFVDTIPVTSTGKYQRIKLKPLFAEFHETQFRERP
ncbi:MAG: acyl--CoA ligase [Candidatus Aenigmarchaeota archaeon]|nr:acyl--CoA ligase [Candidatus Aenigmarchaeota archaeon]